MKHKPLFLFLCFVLSQVCLSGATSWSIKKIEPDWIAISNQEKGLSGCTLSIAHGEGKDWHVALMTDHFLVNNEWGAIGVLVSFNAKKPFTITNRSTKEMLNYDKYKEGLIFIGRSEEVVNWIISKELIEVSIEEMGGTYKTFTFDTRGLKGVMLEAQKRQRAL